MLYEALAVGYNIHGPGDCRHTAVFPSEFRGNVCHVPLHAKRFDPLIFASTPASDAISAALPRTMAIDNSWSKSWALFVRN